MFHRHSVVAQTTSPAMCSDSSCIHRGVLVGTSMGHSLIPADLCQRNATAGLGPFPKTAVLSCPHYLLQRGNVCSTGAPLLLLGWSHWRCTFINLGLAESHGPRRQLEHKVPPPGRIQLLLAAFSFTPAPPWNYRLTAKDFVVPYKLFWFSSVFCSPQWLLLYYRCWPSAARMHTDNGTCHGNVRLFLLQLPWKMTAFSVMLQWGHLRLLHCPSGAVLQRGDVKFLCGMQGTAPIPCNCSLSTAVWWPKAWAGHHSQPGTGSGSWW